MGRAVIVLMLACVAQAQYSQPSGVSPSDAPTIVLLGDSITGSSLGSDELQQDSNNYYVAENGFFLWANYYLGQKLNILHGAGIAGNTTAQMLARLQSDVISYRPQYCFVMGGVNDFAAGATGAQVFANLKAIYENLLAVGIKPIASTITPSGYTTEYWSANQLIRDYARTRGIILVDIASVVTDPTVTPAAYKSGLSTDGVHPSIAGAIAIGSYLSTALTAMFPPIPFLASSNADTLNLLPNPMMSGTGGTKQGTMTGTVATGWIATTGDAGVASVVSRSDAPGAWQQITLSPGIGSGYHSAAIYTEIAVTPGQQLYGGIEISTQNDWVASHTLTVQLKYMTSGYQVVQYVTPMLQADALGLLTVNPGTGTVRIPKHTVPATSAWLDVTVSYGGDGNTAAGSIRVGRPGLYVVP